jgi:hypothetical protein
MRVVVQPWQALAASAEQLVQDLGLTCVRLEVAGTKLPHCCGRQLAGQAARSAGLRRYDPSDRRGRATEAGALGGDHLQSTLGPRRPVSWDAPPRPRRPRQPQQRRTGAGPRPRDRSPVRAQQGFVDHIGVQTVVHRASSSVSMPWMLEVHHRQPGAGGNALSPDSPRQTASICLSAVAGKLMN